LVQVTYAEEVEKAVKKTAKEKISGELNDVTPPPDELVKLYGKLWDKAGQMIRDFREVKASRWTAYHGFKYKSLVLKTWRWTNPVSGQPNSRHDSNRFNLVREILDLKR